MRILCASPLTLATLPPILATATIPLFIGPYAVDSLAHLRPVEPDQGDKVFGLSASQIHRRIQAAARAGGLEGHYTGDSPRAGMRLDLIAAGVKTVKQFYSI